MAIRFADSASWCTTAAIGIGAGLKYNYTPAGYGFQIRCVYIGYRTCGRILFFEFAGSTWLIWGCFGGRWGG